MQSRAEVVALRQGDAVAFAVASPGRCRGRADSIALICAMASAASVRPSPYPFGVDLSRCEVSENGVDRGSLLKALLTRDRRGNDGGGGVLLRAFAIPFEADLLAALREITGQAPFRRMFTPGGHQMSVAMTNCGGTRAGSPTAAAIATTPPILIPETMAGDAGLFRELAAKRQQGRVPPVCGRIPA